MFVSWWLCFAIVALALWDNIPYNDWDLKTLHVADPTSPIVLNVEGCDITWTPYKPSGSSPMSDMYTNWLVAGDSLTSYGKQYADNWAQVGLRASSNDSALAWSG